MRAAVSLVLLAAGLAAQTLSVLPPSSTLSGREASQQMIAEVTNGTFQEDWTRKARWISSNPAVASIDAGGSVKPAGDGEAIITAEADGIKATARVTVRDFGAPFAWSFRNNVIPVLTKAGCNQGACHGALAGKNGFKLTLRGYDPDADYDTLTRQSMARRVSLADPKSSLMLLKPTFAVPHGGGKRFKPDSLEYRIISEWIAAGAPRPRPDDPDVVSLEVFPRAAILRAGAEQQLVARARYSDGREEDVTRWVKFSSSNEGVASVDDHGLVKMNGAGEAPVTLWYSSRVQYARMTTPYDHKIAPNAYESVRRSNYIDDLVVAKLRMLNIAPSQTASDAVFIRRAFLDAAGILPTAEETERFLEDARPDKRTRLIDSLLERDEYVDYWAYKWSDLFLVSSRKLPRTEMWSFYRWIRDGVQSNKPWDVFVREVFTGTGSTREHGGLNYFVIHKDPIDLTENVTLSFLGQRLTCARCHNHPLEKWTQKQYYQMANVFSRIGIKNGAEPGESVIFAKTSGNINHPRLLRPLEPTPLDGKPQKLDSPVDRRLAFAAWLTSAENPFFARAVVNRVWANFMGRGLVHPVDDVRATNPASNEELLSALTKDFVEHKFDLKYLVRTIMNSGTYQLSSEPNATNASDDRFYSRYIVKRLPAEVILDAMSQVTGVPSHFEDYPEGMRALQLPDSMVPSQFLTSFGRPPRVTCEASERSSDPNVAQALHVINGATLNRKLSAPEGAAAEYVKLGLSERRVLDQLFLSAYSRFPTPGETKGLTSELDPYWAEKGEARKLALEDVMWAVLTSKEFLFNH